MRGPILPLEPHDAAPGARPHRSLRLELSEQALDRHDIAQERDARTTAAKSPGASGPMAAILLATRAADTSSSFPSHCAKASAKSITGNTVQVGMDAGCPRAE